ncbi:MAG: hydrogenase expression/formation protein HypE [Lachnospiraceae bacterium]|nr:hydrogenase expression/formation protein HypE [Lachnospiraceae bacterium]
MEEKIMMVHGSGGSATGELIDEIFDREFSNATLDQMEDSAVVPGARQIAMTTDSFVVTPAEFRGGDIGRLCVCGTVNDLLMRGAVPKYLTCGFILEEGLDVALLKRVVHSMAKTAEEAGVHIVAGDTKVVNGNGELYINTAGVGFVSEGVDIAAGNARAGDAIIVSGNVGDHHAAILSERMNIDTDIESDNAPLVDIVSNLLNSGIHVHTLRDVTRGGLATVLKELSGQSKKTFVIEENKVPVTSKVADFAGLLGLDPLYMGNEGKLVAIVDSHDADKALDIIRDSKYGKNAAIIGEVKEDSEGKLIETTELGGERELDILQGEGLPRIC